MMSQQGGSLKNAGGDQNPNTSLDGGMKTQPDTMKMGTQQDVDDGPRRVQQRFQSLSLRDYYDTSALTVILSKGLEELARQRSIFHSFHYLHDIVGLQTRLNFLRNISSKMTQMELCKLVSLLTMMDLLTCNLYS